MSLVAVFGAFAMWFTTPQPRVHLDVGSPLKVEVEAGERNKDVHIDVKKGEVYAIEATGTWCDTKKHCVGPEGYDAESLRKWEKWRRVKGALWFTLIASVNKDDDSAKAIGPKGSFEAPADGKLFFFANDATIMYWNNSGSVSVTITRTK